MVVLSGTGSDGTNGVKAVKEHGGLVIAQAPESAKFDGMPRSVINTGLADFVLSPEEIAEEILNFSNTPLLLRPLRSDGLLSDEDALFSEEETLSHIYTILKNASGIDFTYYKRSTILRRIERRMLVTHTATLSEFARLLGDSPEEVNILVKEILIGVTNFFRDPAFFEKLKYNAIYKIVERAKEDEPIRVWSAGCSTGEEAYSIAILFQEVMEELSVKRDVKIFATDVDSRAIEQAGKGIFSENIIDDVTPDRLAKFFLKQNDQYHISKEIRRMIVFATHNMFSDPPFGKLDLISCRNVMIYFQPVMRRGLFAIFHSALKNGGFLFLGKSETAGEYVNLFKPVCLGGEDLRPQSGGQGGGPGAARLQHPQHPEHLPEEASARACGQSEDRRQGQPLHPLFGAHLPASVVLGEDDTVLHFFGNYSDYPDPGAGQGHAEFLPHAQQGPVPGGGHRHQPLPQRAHRHHLHGHRRGLPLRAEGHQPDGGAHLRRAPARTTSWWPCSSGSGATPARGRGGEIRPGRHGGPAHRRAGAGVPGVPERPAGHHPAAGDGERGAAGRQRGAAHRQ